MRTYFEGRAPLCGDSVIYFPGNVDEKAKENGADFVPAAITQSWGEFHPEAAANIKVFPDSGGVLWRTSVMHAMSSLSPQMVSSGRFPSNLNEGSTCFIYKEEFDEIMLRIRKKVEEKLNSEDEDVRSDAYLFNFFKEANLYFQEKAS